MAVNGSTTGFDPRPRGLRFDGTISLGTILHLTVLIGGIVLAWGTFNTRLSLLEDHMSAIQQVNRRTERIEHYLSSKDSNYWGKD
jgi:hypothetical protein